jgi:DNA-binding transcriptional LysR family regulator
MDLRAMEYFLAVVRTLNFTRAAQHCGVTQPTLTRGIQRLEEHFGGALLARERGNTHLTELGRVVHPELVEIVARGNAAREKAQAQARLGGVDLRIGVMCSIGPARFGPLLRRFRSSRPDVAITLADATPGRLCDRLLSGDLDVALSVVTAPAAERLSAETLYVEQFKVACAPTHPFAKLPRISMRDMDGQTYLSRINCEHRDVLGECLRNVGAKLRRGCGSEREDWIQSLVADGMGVCFLPEFSAVQPGLVLRDIVDSPPARTVCLVTVAGRRRSSMLSAFVDAARRQRDQTN